MGTDRNSIFVFQKPLRRIQIEEIGLEKEEEEKRLLRKNVESVLATQSKVKKHVMARDEATFDAFVKQQKDAPCNRVNNGNIQSNVTADETVSGDVNNITRNGAESPREVLCSEATSVVESSSECCPNKETSPRTSPRLPPVPTSSFQFQADWKILRNNPELCFQYFKVGGNWQIGYFMRHLV